MTETYTDLEKTAQALKHVEPTHTVIYITSPQHLLELMSEYRHCDYLLSDELFIIRHNV